MVHIDAVDLIVDMNEEAARCVTEHKPLHFSDEATRVADLAGPMKPLEMVASIGAHSHITNSICLGCSTNLEVRDAPGL